MSTLSITNFARLGKNADMSFFSDNLNAHLEHLGITPYRLAMQNQIDPALLNKILNGKRPPSDTILQRLASISELNIDLETLRWWRAMNQYGEPGTVKAMFKSLPLEEKLDAIKSLPVEEILATLNELPPDLLEAALKRSASLRGMKEAE
jgi:transcriptional regulator with XRE-family HTH domain